MSREMVSWGTTTFSGRSNGQGATAVDDSGNHPLPRHLENPGCQPRRQALPAGAGRTWKVPTCGLWQEHATSMWHKRRFDIGVWSLALELSLAGQ